MPNIFYILLRRLRVPLILLILIYAVSILGFVLIPGQDNDGNVWNMSFFHAFYFVSYMASTIGFGEIPYAFTDGQRMWTMLTIYASVIGWLYSIGALLAVMQDPAFARLRREAVFERAVKRLRSPFYLVCGYGDTGSVLVQALAEVGIGSVVLDRDESRINELELSDYVYQPLGLVADAAKPVVLEMAGVGHSYCQGCLALTDSDQANLLIALSTELLNPDLRLLARAETADAAANICSFGGNEVIDPFETFAERLEMALDAPGLYLLSEWVTGMPHQLLGQPVFPAKGYWVLAGFGRFGRAVYRRLTAIGVTVRVIDINPHQPGMPSDVVVGYGTEAATLLAAGINRAIGLIAGTHDDATNLSILMTARELNPALFTVARQNQRDNTLIFERGRFDMVMKRGDVVAHRIFALLRTPLISDFLLLAGQQDEIWAKQLLSRIIGVAEDEVPHLWEVWVSRTRTPALHCACAQDEPVRLQTLLLDPYDRNRRLAVIPLLLKRADGGVLLPDEATVLRPNDRVLMCAAPAVEATMDWSVQNEVTLHYLLTGEVLSGSWLWRWWRSRFAARQAV